MPPTYYIWTGDPRKAIPEGFELADVEALVNGQGHKALHVFTGEGEPDLFDWEVWEGEVAPVPEPA